MKIFKLAFMSMFLFSPLMGQVFQPLAPINASVSTASDEPTIVLEETDQVLPAGKWRFRVSGDVLTIDRNTAVAGDFGTLIEALTIDSTGGGFTFGTTAQETTLNIISGVATGFLKTLGFNLILGTTGTVEVQLQTNNSSRMTILAANNDGDIRIANDLRVIGGANPFVGAFFKIESALDNISTPSGSSVTSTGLIPAGSFVVGLVTRVTTTVTGPAGFDIGDGADVDRWGNSIAVASGTTSDLTDATAQSHDSFISANDVVITSDGVDFTGGVIEVIVYFFSLNAPTS